MSRTVSAAFAELLGQLDLTSNQADIAAGRSKGLIEFFDRAFTMAEHAFTIGSYRRGTLVRAERDIDLIAPFSYPTYKSHYESGSRTFLYYVREKLNSGYATTKVSSRGIAVLLDFTVIQADVVPAFLRNGGGYVIPDGKDGWQATNPAFHTELINARDKQLAYRLKPLIRLMKFWNICNGAHLRSFHVELMVWSMWKNDGEVPIYSAALAETISTMRSWIKSALNDPWEGGGRIDSYLSSDERQTVLRMLDDDAKASADAEIYRKADKIEKAFERWGVVFRHEFPAFG